MSSGKSNTIIVTGGGAAGFFAAIAAAESDKNASITILEKSRKVLGKVKISGGGRCNVTNACYDPQELINHYPRGSKELLGPFYRFQPSDTVTWFKEHGVSLKTEEDNRIFPVTDNSQTIVDCLVRTALNNKIKIITNTNVTDIIPSDNDSGMFNVITKERNFECDKIIATTGSSESTWKIFSKLGHKIIPPVPSLFTFNINDKKISGLQGVSVRETKVKIINTRLEANGPLLITHWGMSGPAILKLSAFGARNLKELNYNFQISVNWMPHLDMLKAADFFLNLKTKYPQKNVISINTFGIPTRLWERLLHAAGIPVSLKLNDLSKKMVTDFIGQLTDCRFNVTGKSTFKEEFVTAGGVNLSEVDFKTMQSKLVKNLYFAGEVLDIDAVTGGFNFQAAWTTGWIAGISAVAKES